MLRGLMSLISRVLQFQVSPIFCANAFSNLAFIMAYAHSRCCINFCYCNRIFIKQKHGGEWLWLENLCAHCSNVHVTFNQGQKTNGFVRFYLGTGTGQIFLQTTSKATQVKSYIRTKTTTNCPKWKEHKHLRLKSITLFSLNRNSFFTFSLCILFFLSLSLHLQFIQRLNV